MAGGGAGGFSVEPAELSSLAARVAAIRDQLDATRDLADGVAAALGSETVASALDHFVSGWRDGRKQISTEVSALSAMLAQAAGAYSDTEASITQAIPAAAP